MFQRILMWPVIGLVITGMWHLAIEAIWPDLQAIFVPAVLAPLLLAYGAWVGYGTVEAGGSYLEAIVAGAILGLLPVVLDIVGFGIILDRGMTSGTLSAAFGFSVIVFGALLGAGFVLSRPRTVVHSG